MTKRTLPLLLLLAAACAAGCTPKDTPDRNANVNGNYSRQTDVNLNANGNGNANTETPVAPVRSRGDKSVTIIVNADDSGKLQFLVSPEDIKLSKSKNQRLRFHVFNNTEVDLKEVVITFVSEDPMDGDFKIGDIKAGHDKSSLTRRIKSGAATKSYTYGLKGFDNTAPDPVVVMNSPEVEIAT